ncbi:MAG: pitrilysin family protein [Chloroflexota bacterium]|nr:pitrilysin family protein [Chloroflexota bacterium]
MTLPSSVPNNFELPVDRHVLSNGLRVLLHKDSSSPVVCIAVYYHVGMRSEPKGRTGFAHLFEHLMFQGSQQLGKMELVSQVQSVGGTLNGSTRFDFTNYWEVVPSHALQLVLWMEADRMRGPNITETELANQRDVVKNEIKVNVLNRPYGTFPWLDVQEHAFDNWHNNHNGYGDMVDLDAADLQDVEEFFYRYYSPRNAVLCIAGDFETEEALGYVEKYFADIPAQELPVPVDISESERSQERNIHKIDKMASRPALAVAYRTPERGTKEFYALGLLNSILTVGDDSLLRQRLVRQKGYTSSVSGSMNFLGHMHNAETPLVHTTSLIHDQDVNPDQILNDIDEVIASLKSNDFDEDLLLRAKTKVRSGLYGLLSGSGYPRFGVADLLSSFELLEGNAENASDIPRRFDEVSADDLVRTASNYFVPENRTIIRLEAGVSP